MYDASIGLDHGDSVKLHFNGGFLYVWIERPDRISVSLQTGDKIDDLQIHAHLESGEISAIASPHDRVDLTKKVMTWGEFTRKES